MSQLFTWGGQHTGVSALASFLPKNWRRQWHPTPVLLPGKSHGWRSLEGCSLWGCWGSDTTERLHFHFSLSCIGEGNGNPLHCSCLENPGDGEAWWAAVYGVAQSRTRLKWLSTSKEHPGLISFRMDLLDLLEVQGTLKSLLQHHSSKASIIRHSAFLTVQLSHPYVTTGKTIALTRRTFVGKVMSLLFNMLSRLVITFLPRSKHLLI